MNNNLEESTRHLIPTWKNLVRSLATGDSGARVPRKQSDDLAVENLDQINHVINSYSEGKHTLGDKIELINNLSPLSGFLPSSAISLVSNVINLASIEEKGILSNIYEDYKIDIGNTIDPAIESSSFIDAFHKDIHSKITKQRSLLSNSQLENVVIHLELARLYSAIGLNDKARKHALIADRLTTGQPYIIRSLSRFHVHHGDPEAALRLSRKWGKKTSNPWLYSAEIGLSMLNEKNPIFTDNAFSALKLESLAPNTRSEVAASLGTYVLTHELKKARNLFDRSLECPNENTLSQILYLSNKIEIVYKVSNIHIPENYYEVLTRHYLQVFNFEMAINCCKRWFIDEPFSSRPLEIAYMICTFYLDRSEDVIQISQLALINHPKNPLWLNALAFHKLKIGITQGVDKIIQQGLSSDELTEELRICLIATGGMYYFRIGDIESGNQLYDTALSLCDKHNKQALKKNATLNHIRELYLSRQISQEEAIALINKIPHTPKELIEYIRAQVLKTIHS